MNLAQYIVGAYRIKRSGLFDEHWYLQQYPEVRHCGLSPLEHYLEHGWKEGKNPSERFDSDKYLAMYPDVRASRMNPLIHYIRRGRKEGRCCLPVRTQANPVEQESWEEASPLVSIIVASYNYASLIGQTLDSLLEQTYGNYEIIVVDDGSTDHSEEVILPYLSTGKVRYYTHPGHVNRGLCETVKLGIRQAKGDFIAFCESDDLWRPQYLERKVKIINRYNDVCIISNNVELFGVEDAIRKRAAYLDIINALLEDGGNKIDYSQHRNLNYIATFSAVMIRKDVLMGLNFDSPTPAWLDFWLYRQILKDHLLFYTHEPLTLWRMHDSLNGLSGAKEHVKREGLFLALSDRLLGIPPLPHVLRRMKRIERSAYWDEAYYRSHYGNRLEGLSPLEHYYYVGWKDGCNPSAAFSNDAYLNAHVSLWEGKTHPLLHYERRGKKKHFKVFAVDEWTETPITDEDIEALRALTIRKVLFISHELTLTGAPRALLNMVLAVRGEGIMPVVLSLKPGALEEEIRALGVKLYIQPSAHSRLQFGCKRLERFLGVFDTILFNTLATVPLVQDLSYNPARKIAWLHEGSVSFKHFSACLDLSSLFSHFDGIYAVGDYARSFVEPYLTTGQRVQVENLLYGIPDEADKVRTRKKDGKVRFLLAGSLCKRKGQRNLLKSLWRLPRGIRNQMEVYVAGAPAERRVAKAVKRTPFSCVRYVGELAHDQLLELCRESDVVLCPSLDDPMPIVCTEGMMLGKPVIVSDATGTATLIKDGETGFVVPAGSCKALAHAIRKAVEQKERLPEMGERARKIYEDNFTMPVFEKRLKEALVREKLS